MYLATAAAVAALYTILTAWGILVAWRKRGTADWPLILLVALVCLAWAGWYTYLALSHDVSEASRYLNRTLHLLNISLFTVVFAWRGR